MRFRVAFLLPMACCWMLSQVARGQSRSDVQLWLTNPDKSALFARQATPLHFSTPNNQFPTIDVNAQRYFQTMDGFGFALTGGSAQLLMRMDPARRRAVLKDLFSTEGNDIGVSYLRIGIGSSDMDDRVYSFDDLPEGKTDAHLTKFTLAPVEDTLIPVLREILTINPKIQIVASPWSAPAWMKTNDSSQGGSLKPKYFKPYANYFVKYIQGMKAAGIPIHATTVQNEPLNPKNNPSMVMLASQQDTFIVQYLAPALQKAGIKTNILLYDHNPDVPSYPQSILKDPRAYKDVAGTAFHLYGGEVGTLTTVHDAYPNKNLYLTEQWVTGKPGATTMDIAEPVSRVVIGATRNWSRNVLLWNLAADPNDGPHTNGGCTQCQGAITLDGNKATFNLAYYTIAQFSKFVRPGSVRIGSNDLEQLANVAFLVPDGNMVLIIANTGTSVQTFNIRYRGNTVTGTLLAGSVGTYIWQSQ